MAKINQKRYIEIVGNEVFYDPASAGEYALKLENAKREKNRVKKILRKEGHSLKVLNKIFKK